jgi:SynChlorMet cassette radical SAM/SPASM protein ScmE
MGKRRLRLDSIQVSIDGSCADIHDASRPPASFERALRGLRMLKDAGFPVTVRVTINRYNVDDLENIARLLLEDIGLPAFSTNDVEQMGAALTDSASIALTPEQRRRVMEILPALSDRYGGRIVAKDGPLSLARDFKAITARLACGEAAMPGRGRLGACAYNRMAVLHDGTMVPCNLLPQLTMGTIGRMPLGKAWLHHPSINALRYRNQILMSTLPGCQGCSYTGFCMGGCPGAILAKFGRLNTSDPLACYRDYVDQDCNDVEQDCRFG